MDKLGIVGLGHVRLIMKQLSPVSSVYYEPKKVGYKEGINNCNIVFVCVPTPQSEHDSCDNTIVNNVLEWIHCKIIVVRSTVPVGYTETMS